MRDGETLNAYSGRYWEMYNEMDGNFDDVAINTFKSSLPTKHGIRKSLTGKPTTSMRQLMDRINKYKRVEGDQMQGKGKEKVIPQEMRDFKSDRYTNSRPMRDFAVTRDDQRIERRGCILRTSAKGDGGWGQRS